MEAALSQLTTKILTMLVSFLLAHVVITFGIHKGLKNKIKDYETRKILVSLASLIAISLIAYFVMT